MRMTAPLTMLVLAALLSTTTTGAEPKNDSDRFVSLFNGKDLAGWRGDMKFWSVRDGVITGETTKANPLKKNTFLIWDGGDVADFELRVKCRIKGNNSGIQYRSKVADEQAFVVKGYQADFGAGESHNAKLYEEGGRAGLAYPGNKVKIHANGKKEVVGTFGDAEKLKKGLPEDTWVEYTITAVGNHIVHKIDGETIVEATDEQADKRSLTGVIALQIHNGEPMTVQFKDIRLKKL